MTESMQIIKRESNSNNDTHVGTDRNKRKVINTMHGSDE